MKKAIVIILILAVAAAGAFYFLKVRKKKTENGQPKARTVAVERGPIMQTVEANGSIVSNLDVEIKCRASGEIISLPFDVSDPVRKGKDLLVELDPSDEQRNVNKAATSVESSQASYQKAVTSLAVAERDLVSARKRAEIDLAAAKTRSDNTVAVLERVKELYDKKLASKEELDTAQTNAVQAKASYTQAQVAMDDIKTQQASLALKRQDVAQSRANLDSSNINLGIAKQNYGYTKVFAPIDGVVTARNVQIGQIISSGISNVGGGTSIMTISDLSRLFVLASVDESDIGIVKSDQHVMISVDAFPNERFMGRVDRIAQTGTNTSGVVTFEVKIEIMSPNKTLLKPQMTADVVIVAARSDDALLVPAEAVTRKRRNHTVTVVTGPGKTEEREVQIGITDGINTEITSGLKQGERIQVKQGAAASKWNQAGQQGQGGSDRRRRPRMMMPH